MAKTTRRRTTCFASGVFLRVFLPDKVSTSAGNPYSEHEIRIAYCDISIRMVCRMG